jgi:hypothetical protein
MTLPPTPARRYAFFPTRGVVWAERRAAAAAEVERLFGDDAPKGKKGRRRLFGLLCGALAGLNDSHTFLEAPGDDWDNCYTAADMNSAFEERYYGLGRRRLEEGYGYGDDAEGTVGHAEDEYLALLSEHYLVGGKARRTSDTTPLYPQRTGLVYGAIERGGRRFGYIALPEMASVLGLTGLVARTDAVIRARLSEVLGELGCDRVAVGESVITRQPPSARA